MKIKEIKINNFRGFSSIAIDFDTVMTAIIAANGEGKTAVLDAIAIGMSSFIRRMPGVSGISFKKKDFRMPIGDEKPLYEQVEVTLTNGIVWDRRVTRDKSKRTKKNIPKRKGLKSINEYADKFIDKENEGKKYSLPIIAYYGVGRGIFESPKRGEYYRKSFDRFLSYQNSLESIARFKHYFEHFFFLEDVERREKARRQKEFKLPELEAIRNSIEKMVPSFSNPRTQLRPFRFLIDWKKNGELQSLRIDQLSDGHKSILSIVMDIASRMAQANPNKKDILETEGIVMIDEIEMHLHPSWQQTVLPDLQKTFPNVQFIISTHSPQVVTTVPSKRIRIIENGKVYTPSTGTQGAEASRILKRVFGVDLRPKDDPNVILLNEYLSLVYQEKWDSQEAEEKRRKLDKIYQGEEPALTEADLYIENRKWELADEADM